MNTASQISNPPLLEVRDLSMRFDHQEQAAVDRVSFSIAAGSTLGLVGASGAGKSSIARAILHLIQPDSGEILFKGEDILQMNSKRLMATRRRVQIVFQEPSASLSPTRTVGQTLLEPLNHFTIGDSAYRAEKIRTTLQTVGLEIDVLNRYPHQFSSGQQQRIALARALVTDPELLIADEAVSALDVSIQAQILQLMQSLQEQHGITFLFISHDLAVIRQIADDVAVMYRGQWLEQSPADVFFSEPAHPYSKKLLALTCDNKSVTDIDETWRLDRGSSPAQDSSGCVYRSHCPDKLSACDRLEPVGHYIQYENQPNLRAHCVKCHLHEKTSSDKT